MPLASTLKGREMPNHRYIKREWLNGKWKYTYDNSNGVSEASNPKAKNVSSVSTTQQNKPRETSAWAKAYLANRTKKASAIATTANVSKGKSRASSLVKTNNTNDIYRARTTSIETLNDANYGTYKEKVENEVNEKMKKNEDSYKAAFEKEKESYMNKFMEGLKAKYGEDIPDSEIARVKSKVEEYTKSLWEDVYEPQLKRLNDALDSNKKQILRSLKNKYENDQDKTTK